MSKHIESQSKPFSNGTECQFFTENFCDRCKKGLRHDDMFPEYPENGGCSIWDAMERARFDESVFPSSDIVQLTETDGTVQYYHVCKQFLSDDADVMDAYKNTFEMASE